MSWQTFGHEAVKNILNKQINSGHLSHAYLFKGPVGIGKKTLALEFAQKVLQTQKLENHPDFQILDPPGEITVELTLDFISKLAFKPFLGTKKVAIINNAENLNIQSSNALLKTLEEPSPSTIIILISGFGRVLPTIFSRCQTFNFNGFSAARQKNFAQQSGLKFTDEIIALSFGRIGRLARLANDQEFFNQQSQMLENYTQLRGKSLGEKFSAISRYAELEPAELEDHFSLWLNWQTRELAQKPQDYGKVKALCDSLLGIKINKNKKLLLQSLFLKI